MRVDHQARARVEREMAEMMGMKPEDYAKNKMALQKEGKLQ
jgi:Ni,Fe-hydrogenase III component G